MSGARCIRKRKLRLRDHRGGSVASPLPGRGLRDGLWVFAKHRLDLPAPRKVKQALVAASELDTRLLIRGRLSRLAS